MPQRLEKYKARQRPYRVMLMDCTTKTLCSQGATVCFWLGRRSVLPTKAQTRTRTHTNPLACPSWKKSEIGLLSPSHMSDACWSGRYKLEIEKLHSELEEHSEHRLKDQRGSEQTEQAPPYHIARAKTSAGVAQAGTCPLRLSARLIPQGISECHTHALLDRKAPKQGLRILCIVPA